MKTYTKIITFSVEYENTEAIQEIMDILESIDCNILRIEQGTDKIDGKYCIHMPKK